MGILRITASEFQRNIGRYQDEALRQPVAISRNGRERMVMMSSEEYWRLKRQDREVLRLTDFTADDLAALEAAEAPDEAAQFDSEMNR